MATSKILEPLIGALGVSLRMFERKIGVGQSAIRIAISRGSEIKIDTIEKILRTFPQVSREYLLTGTGEMFVDMQPTLTRKEIIPIGKHAHVKQDVTGWSGLPMYNMAITASFVQTYRDDPVYTPMYYLFDPRFRDCDFGAMITGDSMYSEIRHGDFVACKEITDPRFLVYGDIYYVVSTNGLETCKYIHRDLDDNNNLLLVAYNKSVPPSPIPKEMILKIYKVRGIVRSY